DLGVGKRISNRNNGDALNATESINSFIDYKVCEKDQINLLKSGSEWLGDVYDKKTNYNYSFNFPNIINDSSASFRFYGVARSGVGSQFNIDVSGESFVSSVTPSNITYYAAKYANTSVQEERFYPQGELVQFN